MMAKYTTVSIPAPLADKIKEQIRKTGFTSVSDYVTFVMREVVSQINTKEKGEVSERTVREKLKALGYL